MKSYNVRDFKNILHEIIRILDIVEKCIYEVEDRKIETIQNKTVGR